MRKSRFGQSITSLFLVAFLILTAWALWQRQAVLDWWKLRGYEPPTAIAALAAQDTMTPRAERLFYLNKPVIADSTTFQSNCPAHGEKTIVLGCYKGGANGIYIFHVSDKRLNGVEQVTAAHEMLHAAYDRLSKSERAKVDQQLTEYYQNGLKDERIKTTIDSYKQAEPNDVVNEMHSIFGTEIANLPAGLEKYYSQYFSDRSKVTAFAAAYQGEFTSRQELVERYDARLTALKDQIDANQKSLGEQRANLEAQAARMQSERASGNIAAYNADVATYNTSVSQYNNMVEATKGLISEYNALVEKRNAVAMEEQQLVQAISANPKEL